MVEFPADLIVFPMLELDLILGMDRHRAVVNCYTKEVIFEIPEKNSGILRGAAGSTGLFGICYDCFPAH